MMDDLLKSLLGDAGSQAGGGQAQEDPLAGLLGSVLGGGAPAGAGGGEAQEDPLAGLLGSVLGGGAPAGAGGGEDLLQGLLGGGPQEMGGASDPLSLMLGGGGAPAGAGGGQALAPLANMIADKLGLPPEIAQVVVAFVLNKLLSGGGQVAPPAPARPSQRRRKSKPPRPENLNLGSLLNQARSGEGLDQSHVRATGIHEELAQQTGLDADTAARSLEEVLKLLGGQAGPGQGSRGWG